MPDAISEETAKAQAKLDFCAALQNWGGAMASLRNSSLAAAVSTIKRVLAVADLSTVTAALIKTKIEGLTDARANAAAAYVGKLNADLIAISAQIDAGQIPAAAVNPLG